MLRVTKEAGAPFERYTIARVHESTLHLEHIAGRVLVRALPNFGLSVKDVRGMRIGESRDIWPAKVETPAAVRPATALPWSSEKDFVRSVPERAHVARVAGDTDQDAARDAAYIVHACNAYPQLVQALREAVASFDQLASIGRCPENMQGARIARALLAKLGEGDA